MADDIAKTRRLETERRLVSERLDSIKLRVIDIEVRLCIEKRWEPQDQQYIEVLQYSNQRQYHRALDNLQKLVVQRLFELQKLNLAGTDKLVTALVCIY